MWDFNAAKDKKRKNLQAGVLLFEDDFVVDEEVDEDDNPALP